MNRNRNWPFETYQIIDGYEKNRTKSVELFGYTDVDIDNFKASNIRMLHFMICLKPESVAYGRGIGAFVYKDGRVFKIHYNIHTPHSKGPHLSNQMTLIEQIVLKTYFGITVTECVSTSFGAKAFWNYTPMDCLDPEARSLRELMISIRSYCRKENLCGKLRKLDKVHDKWNTERQMKVVQKNIIYGVTKTRDKIKLALNTGSGVMDSKKTILSDQ